MSRLKYLFRAVEDDDHEDGAPRSAAPQPVRITGLNIPFGDLAMFLVKLVLAFIPAGIILGGLGLLVTAGLAAIGLQI